MSIELLSKIAEVFHIQLETILLECGYIEKEIRDIEVHYLLEEFLMQTRIRDKYQIYIEELSTFEKNELLMHLTNALGLILCKYR